MNVILRFRISCEVPQGQSLVVVGNSVELGSCNPEDGLRTYPQNKNIWRRSIAIKDVISPIEFKYAFLHRNSGKIIKEESDKYSVEIPTHSMDSNDNDNASKNANVQIVQISHSLPNNKTPHVQFSAATNSKSGIAIVVLGKRLLPNGTATVMLQDRVRDTIGLYEQLLTKYTPDSISIVMSGGQVQKGPKVPTEARLMEQLALTYTKSTLPAPRIILEDESLNTIQNALNSKDVLEDIGIREIYLITTQFHMERSMKIFETVLGLGYKIHSHPSQTNMSQKELDTEMSVETRAIAGLKDRFWSLYRISTPQATKDPMDAENTPQGKQTQVQQNSINNNNNTQKKKRKVFLPSTSS